MLKVKIDMTGWVMAEHGVADSKLTVLKQVDDYIDPHGNHRAMWLCECSCSKHNKIIAHGINIRRGLTKSCGCLAQETTKQRTKEENSLKIQKFGSFATLHPELMKYWDGEENNRRNIDPYNITEHSNKIAHWICPIDKYSWDATVNYQSKLLSILNGVILMIEPVNLFNDERRIFICCQK